MDDSYCIVSTKEEANDVLGHMIRKYWEFGLELNVKKTQVVKLSRGFTFLKCKYRIDSSTGRITMKPDKSGMIRMCRKMRKFKKNQIPQDQVENAYKTWRGYWKKLGGNPRKTDILYTQLFGGVA
jgi:hypothetical protein